MQRAVSNFQMSTASLAMAAMSRSIGLLCTEVAPVIRPRSDDAKPDDVTALIVDAAEQTVD